MGNIREELGDVLEPDRGETQRQDNFEEKNTPSYPVHYSEGSRGAWTILNFSEPYGKRQLTPDYAAQRLEQGEYELWSVSAEEGTVEVSIDSDINSKDELADELKNSYYEKI